MRRRQDVGFRGKADEKAVIHVLSSTTGRVLKRRRVFRRLHDLAIDRRGGEVRDQDRREHERAVDRQVDRHLSIGSMSARISGIEMIALPICAAARTPLAISSKT